MLTEDAYNLGLAVYAVAAVIALLLFNLWFLRGRSAALRIFLCLPLAALLLTPAFIEPGADTLAPALIIAGFQWFSQGPDAAEHALRPLGLLTAAALGLGLVIALLLVVLRRNRA